MNHREGCAPTVLVSSPGCSVMCRGDCRQVHLILPHLTIRITANLFMDVAAGVSVAAEKLTEMMGADLLHGERIH